MQDFPSTIEALRRACTDIIERHPLTLWDRFETFFIVHGYALWVAEPKEIGMWVPPDGRRRAPDGFVYQWQENSAPKPAFVYSRPIFCPARCIDGRDVLIRIVSIGQSGAQHKCALERLATGNVASVMGNHCAPVLQWLSLEDVTFAVFPLLGNADPSYFWDFEDVGDVLATVEQLFEAVAFCHERLVAHRDIFPGNIVGNFIGGGPDTGLSRTTDSLVKPARPFRSLFPLKLYLIDFELAVCYEPGSAPETHVVTGLPTGDASTYARYVAPEMAPSQVPYSPFSADVWQLGHYIWGLPVQNLPSALAALLRRMIADSPAARPTSSEALLELRGIFSSLSEEELRTAAVYLPPFARPYD